MLRLRDHFVPDNPTAPYPPSPVEAKHYYYGIPSYPRLVARSSIHNWTKPNAPETYLLLKELSPLGSHKLNVIWEGEVGPIVVAYLDGNGIQWTSIDPVRIGHAGQSSPPAILWVGVLPNSLTAEDGIKVVTHLRGVLSDHGVDMHVEIRQSLVTLSARLYEPVVAEEPTVEAREPFSTTLGLPIAAADAPEFGGTGGLYVTDSDQPGKLFLLTNRHVVFRVNEEANNPYNYATSSQKRRNVLLCSDPAVERYTTAIQREIETTESVITHLERRIETARTPADLVNFEIMDTIPQLRRAQRGKLSLDQFILRVSKEWPIRPVQDRVIGHVVLSPPIGLNVGKQGFTEDWALIELDQSKFNGSNFVGNAIDLGTTIPIIKWKSWMSPDPANPHSFDYPVDRLMRFRDFIPDNEMWKPDEKTRDQHNDPVIMVMKRGQASGITAGRLNTIRSFARYPFENVEGQMSKEISVLPCDSSSGPFSEPGDSGSSVIDGRGRLAGMITGGTGDSKVSDIAYVTSANFLQERIASHNLKPNFFPSPLFDYRP